MGLLDTATTRIPAPEQFRYFLILIALLFSDFQYKYKQYLLCVLERQFHILQHLHHKTSVFRQISIIVLITAHPLKDRTFCTVCWKRYKHCRGWFLSRVFKYWYSTQTMLSVCVSLRSFKKLTLILKMGYSMNYRKTHSIR